MDRKLIDYLPTVLRSVFEFMEITGAQQPEIERAWSALDFVMANQFIDDATEEGVAVWESELGIVSLNIETLENRKKRIKTAWTYGVVYTYNWLVDWIKSSYEDNVPLPKLDGYVLKTYLPASVDYIQVIDNMRGYISSNILINPVILLTKINMPIFVGSVYRIASKQTIKSDSWDLSHTVTFTDENDALLTDENGDVLYEEIC